MGRYLDPATDAIIEVPDVDAQRLGLTPATPEHEVAAAIKSQRADEYGGVGGAINALQYGGARGLTAGFSDLGLRLLAPDLEDEARRYKEQNPGLSTIGEGGGMILGAGAAPGTGLAQTPSALTTRLGMALGAAGPEAGILARTGRAALGGAVDAGLQSTGQGISDLAMSDDPLTIERVAGELTSRFVTGAEFGGAIGGTLGLLEHGLTTGARRLKLAREGAQEAEAAALTGGAIPEDIAVLDRAGVKDARNAELARIEATRVPERGQLVDELQKFREQTKTTRPWDAVAVGGTKDSLAAMEAEAARLAKLADKAELRATATEGKLITGGKRPPRTAGPAPAGAEAAQTWKEFVAERMGARMKSEGGHGPAMKKLGEEWKAYKAGAPLEAPVAAARTMAGESLTTRTAAAREAAAEARQLADEAGAALETARTASEAVAPRWMREAGKTYIEADKHIDRLLRNREGLAEAGGESMRKSFRAALQEQRQALQEIQDGAAELNIIHATDTSGRRAAALASVPDTIAANRALQDRIEQLATAPASPRLSALESHDLMLGQPKPPPTLGQKLKAAAAYAGTSAIGYAVLPAAAGFAVPVLGALAASKALGGKLGPAMVKAHRLAMERTERAVGAFLSGTRAARRVAPKLVAMASTAILEGARFGPEHPADAPAPARRPRLEVAYEARARELAAAIMPTPAGPKVRPGVRANMGRQLAALHAVAPHVADRAESLQARKLLYLYGKMPRPMQLGMTTIAPDELALRSWARTVAAAEDPGGIEERLAAGTITPEDGEVMRELYPARMAEVMRQIMTKLGDRRLPYESRINLSFLTGQPVDGSMAPHIIDALQRDFTEEPGTEGGTQAPQPQPAFGSVKRSEPTPAQRKAG